MRIINVKFVLKPEYAEKFVEVSLGDAKGSVSNEPGCYRFDVYRDKDDPNTVCFYEVYSDDEAIAAHQQMPHYLKWRSEWSQDWLAEKTQIIQGVSVWPPDGDWGNR